MRNEVQRRLLRVIHLVDIRSGRNQALADGPRRSEEKGRLPVLVAGVGVSAALQQDLDDLPMSSEGCRMKSRSAAKALLPIRVSATAEEFPADVHSARSCSRMQPGR